MNSYELTRSFFDWCFENPEKVTPNHVAVYCFSVEHCNRLGWKKNFGLPTTMVMEAVGIKSYNTYIKTFNDLVKFGFIILVEKSRNQYSANIIALSKFNKALDKALDKALIKHSTKQPPKQSESTIQSNDSIDKQYNKQPIYNITNIQSMDLDFSVFSNPNILQTWCDWLNYKKEQFKDEYKSLKSHQIAINKLAKFSKNDSELARLIIEDAMSNIYKGFFELKKQNNNGTINNETGRTRTLEDQADDLVRRVNALYSESNEQHTDNESNTEDGYCQVVE